MKKFFSILLISSLAFFGIFGFMFQAKAYEVSIAEQYTVNEESGDMNPAGSFKEVIQTFTAEVSGEVTEIISMWRDVYGSARLGAIKIYESMPNNNFSNFVAHSNSCNPGVNTIDISGTEIVRQNACKGGGSNFEVIQGNVYYIGFQIQKTGLASERIRTYGDPVDNYLGGSAWLQESNQVTSSISNIEDLFFAVIGDFGVEETVIAFDMPASTCNFENWSFGAIVGEDVETADRLVGVQYGISPIYNIAFDDSISETIGPDVYNFFIPTDATFASGTAYYARAYICESNNPEECEEAEDMLAISPNYDFIYAGNEQCTDGRVPYAGWTAPYVTSTEPINNWTCDETSGFFGSSMCNAMQYLFVPSNNSLSKFTNLKETFENKPPFGYVTVYSNAINNLGNATSTTSTISGVDNSVYNFLKNLEDNAMISAIKNIVTWILWLCFAFYIWHRFKNFEFK